MSNGYVMIENGFARRLACSEYLYWMHRPLPFGWMIIKVPGHE